MPERFRVAAGTGQLAGIGEVRGSIGDQARPDGRFAANLMNGR